MQYAHLNEETEGSDLRLSSNHASDIEANHDGGTISHDDTTLDDPNEVSSVALSSISSKFSRRRQSKKIDSAELQQPLTASEDPYYVFREDLYDKLDLVEETLTEYLRLVQQTDTAVNTHELKDCKKQLKRHIKNAESTLKDVQTTVNLVESQQQQQQHKDSISNSELYDRKAVVTTCRDRILKAKSDMNSQQVKSKLLADERAKQMRRAALQLQQNGGGISSNHGDSANSNNGEHDFIVDSAARTSLLMQHQDETLEELDEAVTRVGSMAGNIHDEINMQSKMLDEMEEDLDDAEEKLGLVMGKLAKMLKTKDKCQIGTILMLIVTVIVLFFLVVYT